MGISVKVYWCGVGGRPYSRDLHNDFEVHVDVDGRRATGVYRVGMYREAIDVRYYRMKKLIARLVKDWEPPPNISDYWW